MLRWQSQRGDNVNLLSISMFFFFGGFIKKKMPKCLNIKYNLSYRYYMTYQMSLIYIHSYRTSYYTF